MKWIEYNKNKKLQNYKDYLVTLADKDIKIYRYSEFTPRNWSSVVAYMELPKPYEKPKSLKERLDEAVEKYCYKFSDKEWKNTKIFKFFILFNLDMNNEKFEVDHFNGKCMYFDTYLFYSLDNAQSFIKSFSKDELMQIMKGEVK